MKKRKADQQASPKIQSLGNYYTTPSTATLAIARLADDIRRAEHWAVHTPADAALLRRLMAEFRSALEVAKDSPDTEGLWDNCQSLAEDIVSRLITGRIELVGGAQ